MGYAKNHAMDCQERGYDDSDSFICPDCIGNPFLRQYCLENGEASTCSYCGMANDSCIALENLMEPIMDGIRQFYESCEEYRCYDDEMPDFICQTISKDDLIFCELSEDLAMPEAALTDIVEIINIDPWCERDPLVGSEEEVMKSLWDKFVDMVTRESRYVFFKRKTNPDYDDYNMEPYEILEYIGRSIDSLNLYQEIKADTVIYRARMHQKAESSTICTAKELGPPPFAKAKANRMSAEGIAMFYGASNELTALNEVYSSQYEMASVAKFVPARDLYCIDLSVIQEVVLPSIFDIEHRMNRSAIRFLRELHADLTKNISSMKAIEYVPAQIVAEYFRFIFQDEAGRKVDGMVYNSAQNPGNGICYALFFDADHCREWFGASADNWVLRLDVNDIRRYAANPPFPRWIPTT